MSHFIPRVIWGGDYSHVEVRKRELRKVQWLQAFVTLANRKSGTRPVWLKSSAFSAMPKLILGPRVNTVLLEACAYGAWPQCWKEDLFQILLAAKQLLPSTHFIKDSIPASSQQGRASRLMPVSPQPTCKVGMWVGGSCHWWHFFSKHEAEVLNLAYSELKVHRWIESLDGSAQRKTAHDYTPGFTEQPVPFSRGWGGGSCSWEPSGRASMAGISVQRAQCGNPQRAPSVLCGWKDSPNFQCIWNRWQGTRKELLHLCF